MANTQLGKVCVTPKGEYNATVTYQKLDIVRHEGASYIVKRECTGVTPVDGDDYMLIASGSGGDGGDAGMFGGETPAFYTPYENRAHNGDFRRWVAQAGIGGAHGARVYGGDRWVLDSGTITGKANANHDGYSEITLNGTIRQTVANPEPIMTAFVGTLSGEATVSYFDGELSISSDGGVLDWVLLLPGIWDDAPCYVPNGYALEFLVCQQYYIRINYAASAGDLIAMLSGTNGTDCFIPIRLSVPMATDLKPTASFKNVNVYPFRAGGKLEVETLTVYGVGNDRQSFCLKFKTVESVTAQTIIGLRLLPGGYFDMSVDLEE